jgi:5-methylcytosine-specific restriction endonuclease McrA
MFKGSCKLCGEAFAAKSGKKNHCSDKCRDNDRYRSNVDARERKKIASKHWYHKNREHVRQVQQQYYNDHYELFAARNFAQRGRILDSTLVKSIMVRDDYTCQYCHKRGGKLTIDHKLPVSRGGKDHGKNLCVACHTCNCRKGTKTTTEYREYLNASLR